MFSDKELANAGRDSVEMLREAVARVKKKGFAVSQVDVTIIAESPRMMDHKAGMRARLAPALGVKESDVSVKAKSNEGMGWIGRGEGIACVAVATLVTK